MSTPTHTQQIKVRSTQMEMPVRATRADQVGFEEKLRATDEELARIQSQREELARKKQEIEELGARKRTFISQQAELHERLSSAITLIHRELEVLRQDGEDLEQCRIAFASHLDKLQKINPESWTSENMADRLERAGRVVDIAADEYEQAAAHFENGRCGAVFGGISSSGRQASHSGRGEFSHNLRNGLAFNLPLCVLGAIALLIWLLK